MFIGKNQDGTFSISKSQMINEDYKWIVEDDGSNEKVYTLFKNNFKDAEHFENSLELSEPISSDDYESIELVSKTEFLNKVFDRLSNSLVHYIDGEGDPFEKKNKIRIYKIFFIDVVWMVCLLSHREWSHSILSFYFR